MTSIPSIAHAPARTLRAYHPTRAEQETVVRWDREDPTVHVWSANPAVWRKMARLGFAPTKESHWPDGAVAGRWYRIPLAAFRWGVKRTLTPAQKARLAVRSPLRRRVLTPEAAGGVGEMPRPGGGRPPGFGARAGVLRCRAAWSRRDAEARRLHAAALRVPVGGLSVYRVAGNCPRRVTSELVAIQRALVAAAREAAKGRQAHGGPRSGKLPERSKGDTRDQVAAYTGVSGRMLEKMAADRAAAGAGRHLTKLYHIGYK